MVRVRGKRLEGGDEIGDLTASFNTMVEELKSSREAVVAEKSKLETTIRGMSEAMVFVDAMDNIALMNSPAEGLFRVKKEELIGKNVLECPSHSAREKVMEMLEAFKKGDKQNVMAELRYKGRVFEVSHTAVWEQLRYLGTVLVANDITERKKAEEEIKQLKEFNEKIVQGLQEGILIEDSEGHVIFANPRMIEMLGYAREALLGMHWSSFVAPGYRKKMDRETRKRSEGVKSRYEVALVSKSGEEIPVVISATPVFENGDFKGVLAVTTDISDIKKAEEEMIQKMMRYKVERGNAYLVKEKRLEKGKDVFLDLLNCGFKGLIITRTPPTKVKEMCEAKVPIVWLSEKRYDKMTIPPNFFLIEKTIENYLERDRAVLIDRLDYLILKNGFEKTMEFIQKLCELFFISKGILILSLDPEILSENELRLLEKEVAEVKLKHEPDFPEDLYEILEFVYEQNRVGKKPAHKDVEENFKITRTTARKRINRLKHLGLIESSKRGKYKVLKLTEKGKAFF